MVSVVDKSADFNTIRHQIGVGQNRVLSRIGDGQFNHFSLSVQGPNENLLFITTQNLPVEREWQTIEVITLFCRNNHLRRGLQRTIDTCDGTRRIEQANPIGDIKIVTPHLPLVFLHNFKTHQGGQLVFPEIMSSLNHGQWIQLFLLEGSRVGKACEIG